PSNQRLCAYDPSRAELVTGLVGHLELAQLEAPEELLLHPPRACDARRDLRVEEPAGAAADPLGFGQGNFRLSYEILGRGRVPREERHPDTGARGHISPEQQKSLLDAAAEPLRELDRIVRTIRAELNDDEFVAADARDEI